MTRITYSGNLTSPGEYGGAHQPVTISLPAGFAATIPSTRAAFVSLGHTHNLTASSFTVSTYPGNRISWMVTGETETSQTA